MLLQPVEYDLYNKFLVYSFWISSLKRSFGMAYQYYKNLCLEKSLLSDFEEPDANFYQLLLLHPTFHSI
jgi:hypothetical protein